MNKIIRYFKFQWSLIKGYSLETKLKIKKKFKWMSQNKTHVEISFWRALYRTTTVFLIIGEYLICNLMLIVFTIFFEIFIMCMSPK